MIDTVMKIFDDLSTTIEAGSGMLVVLKVFF